MTLVQAQQLGYNHGNRSRDTRSSFSGSSAVQLSPPTLRNVSAICLMLCGSQTFVGCGQSQPIAAPGAAKVAGSTRTGWQPLPIELPASQVVAWANEEERAKSGPVWAGDDSAVRLIRFNFSGDSALVVLHSGALHLVDPKTGTSRQSWNTENKAKLLALEPTWDSKRVVLQYENDEHVYVRDLTTGTLLQTLGTPKEPITVLAVGADPRLLAAGGPNGSLKIWNIETGQVLESGTTADEGTRITAIAISNDCQQLYVAAAGSTNIEVFQLPGLTIRPAIKRSFGVPVKLATSWSGNWLFAVCHNRLAEIIAIKSAEGARVQLHHPLSSGPIRRGDLDNCCHLSNINFVCCYLGGTTFDYYDSYLNPAGSIEGQESENEGVVAVALARDGSVAASGYRDGSVRFYGMPGPVKPAVVRNSELGQRLSVLLKAEKYDELDELANTSLGQVEPDVLRQSPATVLIDRLSNVGGESEENYTAHFAKLQQWLDAKPDSRAARLVMATTLKDHGWFFRGKNIAALTGREAMEKFLAELAKADKLLKDADEIGPPSAPLCAVWALVKMGLGRPKDELVKLWERGIEQTPKYAALHQTVGQALLPIWLGDKEDTAKLANRSLRELPGDAGLLAYAAIAETFIRYQSAASIVSAGFNLDDLEKAAQRVVAVHPENRGGKNVAAIVACLRRQHAAAATRFVMIAAGVDQRLWRPFPLLFEKFRNWSQGKSVASDSVFSFLGSWMGLTQIAFEREGGQLITLGPDSGEQIRIWNVGDQKVDRVMSLPPVLVPLSMSDQGRFIVCVTATQDRRMVLLDSTSGKVIPCPNVRFPGKGRISLDERQFATFGQDANIAVYDLAESLDEPAHVLKLETVVTALEFPHNQKVWSIIASEPNGRLRVLSEEGKDLITPVQTPRPIERLKAVPNSSRVLACGRGLLAALDVATGSLVKLVDVVPDTSDQFNYTALAVTSDGLVAAAARAHSHPLTVEQPYEIEIWDLSENRKLYTLAGHEAAIHTMSFSRDCRLLASGDILGFVQIWNVNAVRK